MMKNVYGAVAAAAVSTLTAAAWSQQAPAVTPAPTATPDPAGKAAPEATITRTEAAAQVAAAVAKVESQAAKKDRDRVQQQFDEARAGRLIRFGVTAGYSVVTQTGSFEGSTEVQQVSLELTTMPYLVVVPWYWVMKEHQATYCASRFIDGDNSAATSVARARARARAKAGLPRSDQQDLESSDPATREAAQAKLDAAELKLWDPEKDGRCWPTAIGVYVGRPLNYQAEVGPSGAAREQRLDVQPTASIGLAVVPNSYITFLLGVTHARATVPASGDQPAITGRFVTFTGGIGGNLDLLGAIF